MYLVKVGGGAERHRRVVVRNVYRKIFLLRCSEAGAFSVCIGRRPTAPSKRSQYVARVGADPVESGGLLRSVHVSHHAVSSALKLEVIRLVASLWEAA